VAGLDVVLKDRTDGSVTCAGSVTAIDGAYTEELLLRSDPVCSFAGAFGRAGHYVIMANAPYFEPATITGVVVRGRGCALATQLLTIGLSRYPSIDAGISGAMPVSSSWKDGRLEYVPNLRTVVQVGDPIVRSGAISITSQLMRAMTIDFGKCYHWALARDANLQGVMRLAIDVNNDGSVRSATPERDAGAEGRSLNDELVDCVARHIATTGFAPPENGAGCTFVLPITLRRN
jgi:hypothetical protein